MGARRVARDPVFAIYLLALAVGFGCGCAATYLGLLWAGML